MTMPSITDLGQPGESLQRARRGYHDDFTDQHGRRFAAQYDLGNQRPIGELALVGFNPPWLPPMRFIQWERHGSFRFRWDYDAMASELVDDSTNYYASVMDFMLEHMKGEPIPDFGEPVPAMVVRSPLGKPPLSPAIVLACQAGDPWALGMPDAPINTDLKMTLEQSTTSSGRAALLVVRERLAQMIGAAAVPTRAPEPVAHAAPRSINSTPDVVTIDPEKITYNEFVKECKRADKGMSMPEIVSAWREHRANLAEDKAA